MRYVSQPVEFISASKTQTGDYTNYYCHVKDGSGYLSKFTCTEEGYNALQNAELGDSIALLVLSYNKKYKRKDGSGDFWMHRELVTDVRFLRAEYPLTIELNAIYQDA